MHKKLYLTDFIHKHTYMYIIQGKILGNTLVRFESRVALGTL